MFEAKTQIRVRYKETDQMGVVYYGNYPTFYEVGRVEAIRDLGYSYKAMEEEGVMMPVVDLHIKYLRPAKYDDLLTVVTRVKERPNRRIIFHAEIYNEAGTLLNKGEVTLFFVDSKNFQVTQIPDRLKAAMDIYFPEEG